MLPLFNVGSDGYLVMDDGEGVDVRGYRCTTVLISDATAISCWREVVTSSNHFTSSNQYNTQHNLCSKVKGRTEAFWEFG